MIKIRGTNQIFEILDLFTIDFLSDTGILLRIAASLFNTFVRTGFEFIFVTTGVAVKLSLLFFLSRFSIRIIF